MKERSHAMVPCKTWYEVTPNSRCLYLDVCTMPSLQWVPWLTRNSPNLNIRWHWSCSWSPRSSHQHNITSFCRCLHFQSRPEYGFLLNRTNSRVYLNLRTFWTSALTTLPLHRNAFHQTGIAMYQFCCGRVRNFMTATIFRSKTDKHGSRKENLHVVFPGNAVACHAKCTCYNYQVMSLVSGSQFQSFFTQTSNPDARPE